MDDIQAMLMNNLHGNICCFGYAEATNLNSTSPITMVYKGKTYVRSFEYVGQNTARAVIDMEAFPYRISLTTQTKALSVSSGSEGSTAITVDNNKVAFVVCEPTSAANEWQTAVDGVYIPVKGVSNGSREYKYGYDFLLYGGNTYTIKAKHNATYSMSMSIKYRTGAL